MATYHKDEQPVVLVNYNAAILQLYIYYSNTYKVSVIGNQNYEVAFTPSFVQIKYLQNLVVVPESICGPTLRAAQNQNEIFYSVSNTSYYKVVTLTYRIGHSLLSCL